MGKTLITAESPQSVQQFKPTLGMEKWLDTQVELKTDNISEISTVSGLSKTNWYTWIKDNNFKVWYFEQYRMRRSQWLPTLDRIGMSQSELGKYDFWKDMRKAAGEVEQQSPSVQVNFLTQIKKDKEEFGI